ncbi:MAG TPA: hypothetical protein VHE30_07750 [Polyangiaceae bacterium]|nr:hypothetical protein [Polyangiaceae bacterium]
MARFSAHAVVFSGIAFAAAGACAPKSGSVDDTSATQKGAGGGASSGGSANGTSGSGATLAYDGGGLLGIGNGSSYGRDGGGADAKCGELVLEPEAITVETKIDLNCSAETPEPIALYIVLDNSGSMKDDSKWTDAVSALTTFVQSDPSATGKPWTCVDKDGKTVPPPPDLAPPGSGSISVAIQYFHPQNVGSNPNECDGTSHAKPAVPMGPIPANGGAIVGSLGQTGPRGNTPTVGALTGGTNYCAGYQADNPGKKCVVVLVTDGQPNGCGLSSDCPSGGGTDCVDPNSASTLTPIAQTGLQNGVVTFTVGMSGVTADGFTLLDAIAVAGGSDCTPGSAGNEACNITTGGAKGFLDALNTIRSTVQVSSAAQQTVTTTQTSTLPCQWTIPTPTDGKKFQKDLVNVSYSIADATTRVGKVASAGDCTAAGGWYYDVEDAPTRILTCPDTCTQIQSDPKVHVEVLVGCKSEPAVAR